MCQYCSANEQQSDGGYETSVHKFPSAGLAKVKTRSTHEPLGAKQRATVGCDEAECPAMQLLLPRLRFDTRFPNISLCTKFHLQGFPTDRGDGGGGGSDRGRQTPFPVNYLLASETQTVKRVNFYRKITQECVSAGGVHQKMQFDPSRNEGRSHEIMMKPEHRPLATNQHTHTLLR